MRKVGGFKMKTKIKGMWTHNNREPGSVRMEKHGDQENNDKHKVPSIPEVA